MGFSGEGIGKIIKMQLGVKGIIRIVTIMQVQLQCCNSGLHKTVMIQLHVAVVKAYLIQP